MSVADELRRAAVERFYDLRDELVGEDVVDPCDRGYRLAGAARELVAAWQAAPLVEYAEKLGEAITAAPVIEAMVAEREDRLREEIAELVNSIIDELVEELAQTRREATLLAGRVAALEPAAFDPAEPDLLGDEEPDLVGATHGC